MGYLAVSAMLPKENRVKKALFAKVFRLGHTFSSPHLTLRVVAAPKEGGKFSFVVSKTVAKGAVKRNLLRRRGYSIVREMKGFGTKETVNIFFLKKGAEKLSYRELASEVESLFIKAGMLKK